MHPRRPSPAHQEAVSRRLALLSAELAAVRPGPCRPRRTTPGRRVRPPGDRPPGCRASGRRRTRRPRRCPCPGGTPPVASAVPSPTRSPRPCGAACCSARPRSRSSRCSSPSASRSPAGGWSAATPARSSRRSRRRRPAARPAGFPGVPAAPAAPLPFGATGAPGPAGPSRRRPRPGRRRPGSVTVDVAGKVRRPGIAVLDAGARVVDALEAAGGARRGVDLSALNLARPLVDGEQILVGVPAPPGWPALGGPRPPAPPAGAAGQPQHRRRRPSWSRCPRWGP